MLFTDYCELHTLYSFLNSTICSVGRSVDTFTRRIPLTDMHVKRMVYTAPLGQDGFHARLRELRAATATRLGPCCVVCPHR